MKITREAVTDIWGLLRGIKESRVRMPLSTASLVSKNFRIFNDEVKDINDVQKRHRDNYPPELKELEDKRISLCEQYADKDEKGKPVQVKRKYKMSIENTELFNKEFETVREQFKEHLAKKDEIDNEFLEYLKEEIEVNFVKIKASGLNNLDFTADEAAILEPIIDYEE